MQLTRRPYILMVLDGCGLNPQREGNAIETAGIPNLKRLMATYPYTRLDASGEAVGLSPGQMGDSNVGHLNLGAGRVVYQELVRIDKAIREGDFARNPVFLEAMRTARERGTALHLMGLVSPGGVHSHSRHLYALLRLAAAQGLSKVFIHAFLDGRDVPPASAAEYLEELEEKLKDIGIGEVATVSGRYYAMDRDKRWDRTEKAYRALVLGEGESAATALQAVKQSYAREVTDEFVVPTVIRREGGEPVARVRDGDVVIFFNFRPDRARQLTHAFVDDDFAGFDRPGGKLQVHFVCLAEYEANIPAPVAFPPQELRNTAGEVFSREGLKQLRIAETEKYAHVTFFFNGGEETPFPGEERKLIPSPKVATYDLKPEMSAYEVTEAVCAEIAADNYDVIIMNYANLDMVGHTGVMAAAVAAAKAVDECVGRVVEATLARGGVVLITGDHGNAEIMKDPQTGEPHTAHTTDPVPFLLVDPQLPAGTVLREGGILADVAPTLLKLMGIPQPAEMTGKPLF